MRTFSFPGDLALPAEDLRSAELQAFGDSAGTWPTYGVLTCEIVGEHIVQRVDVRVLQTATVPEKGGKK